MDFFETKPPQPISRDLELVVDHPNDRAVGRRHPHHEPLARAKERDLVRLDQRRGQHPESAFPEKSLRMAPENRPGLIVDNADKRRKLVSECPSQETNGIHLEFLNRPPLMK